MNLYLSARAKWRGGGDSTWAVPSSFFLRPILYPSPSLSGSYICALVVQNTRGRGRKCTRLGKCRWKLRTLHSSSVASPSFRHPSFILSRRSCFLFVFRSSLSSRRSSRTRVHLHLSLSLFRRLSLQSLLVSAVKVLNYTGLKFDRPCGSTPRDGILPPLPRDFGP